MSVSYNLISCKSSVNSLYNVVNTNLNGYEDENVKLSNNNYYTVELNQQYFFNIPTRIITSLPYTLTIESCKINDVEYLTSSYIKTYYANALLTYNFPSYSSGLLLSSDYTANTCNPIFSQPSTSDIESISILSLDFQEVLNICGNSYIYVKPTDQNFVDTKEFFCFGIQIPKNESLVISGSIDQSGVKLFSLTIEDGACSFLYDGEEYRIYETPIDYAAFYKNSNSLEVLSTEDSCPCDTQGYKLTNCSTHETKFSISDFSEYVGIGVKISEYEGCWEVEEMPENIELTITDSFRNCKYCLPKCSKPNCE